MSGVSVAYHELVSILGEKGALLLSIMLGGDDVYIPTVGRLARSRSVILREIIGMDAAAALAEHYGGERVSIPIGPGRRAVVWALRQAGWKIGEIARHVYITQRTVLNILNGNPPALLPAAPAPERRTRQLPPPLGATEESLAGDGCAQFGVTEGDAGASSFHLPSIRVLTVV